MGCVTQAGMFLRKLRFKQGFSLLAATGFALFFGGSSTTFALDFRSTTQAAQNFHDPNPALETLFRNALLDINHQIVVANDGTAYVKTGDIPAQWMRDSSAQVRPLLYFAKQDPQVSIFLKGVITRLGRYINVDPYANAFRADYSVWSEEFELDSLAAPLILAWDYWKQTNDTSLFTAELKQAFTAALSTMELEQNHNTNPRHYTHDQLKKNPVGYTGMIWSGFRPSDDACLYNYLVPSNMMAVVALRALHEIAATVYQDELLAQRAQTLAISVQAGIEKFGIVTHTQKNGTTVKIYAYEVDGLGHSLQMDDANLPNLMTAPYVGYLNPKNETYQTTRKFILSSENPYYFAGQFAQGMGSPHTAAGMVWPLGLLSQALTATPTSDGDEYKMVLRELLASDPGDHLLHESFDPNNPKNFTRPDFGWPNSLFAELILTHQFPDGAFSLIITPAGF